MRHSLHVADKVHTNCSFFTLKYMYYTQRLKWGARGLSRSVSPCFDSASPAEIRAYSLLTAVGNAAATVGHIW